MRRALTICLVALTLSYANTVHAQEPAGRGVEVGLRAGYSIPNGDLSQSSDIRSFFSSRVPLWLDAGYRFNAHVYVGATFQYGFLSFAQTQPVGYSAHDLQFGVMLAVHLLPERPIDPWVGFGVGYEVLSAGGNGFTATFDGFQLLNVQAGVDYKILPSLGLGPFAAFSVADFANGSETLNGQGWSALAPINYGAIHEWLTFGVRGAFDFRF